MWANVLWISLAALPVAAQVKAAVPGCLSSSGGASTIVDGTFSVEHAAARRIPLQLTARQTVLVRVVERDIDVFFEVVDSEGKVIARADNPVPRSGIALAYIDAATPSALLIRSKEHVTHQGSVTVQVLPADAGNRACESLRRQVAAADAQYAAAHALANSIQKNAGTSAADAFAAAAKRYEQLLAPGTPLDPHERGEIELALASLHYYDLFGWQASATWAIKAKSSFSAAVDPYLEARAGAVLAAAWLELGTASATATRGTALPTDSRDRFNTARKLLGELEAFHRKRGEIYDAELQTNNVGLSYYYEARFEEAVVVFRGAQEVFRRLKETPREALAQQNIALCLWGQGHLRDALGEFDEALDKFDRVRRSTRSFLYNDLYLLTLNNSALAHYSAGQYDKSLRLHELALAVSREVEIEFYRARSLYGLGVTYYALGDRQLASQLLGQALAIWTPEVDARGRVSALRALAVIASQENRHAEAIKYNLEALELAAAPSARARIKVRLGANYASLGNIPGALEQLDPVINDPPGGDLLVQAEARLERGRIWRRAANNTGARGEFDRALASFRALQSVSGEFDTQLEISRSQVATGQSRDGRNTLNQALALGDEIGAQTANPEYRASVAESLRPAQELMLELQRADYERALTAGNRDLARKIARESLVFADGTRARAFGQRLMQRFEGRADPRLTNLLEDREKLSRDLADRRFYLSTREDRAGATDARAKILRDEIAELRVRLGRIDTDIAGRVAGDPAAQRLDRSGRLEFTQVPANRALVEYWVGAGDAYAWVATRDEVEWLRIGSGLELQRAARQLHAAMQNYATTPAKARAAGLTRLHGLVIAPLQPRLAGIQELVIAPDGPLHVVPFAALRAGGPQARYLIQDLSVAFVPALRYATSPAASRATKDAPDRMLIVADPVYQPDDERLVAVRRPTAPRPELPATVVMREAVDIASLVRLRATGREAATIGRGMGNSRVELLEGTTATIDELLKKDLASYRYIHIAAHGIIDTEIPQLSALVLGAYGREGRVRDQQLSVSDLLTETFNADVVVLSACNTSLGPAFSSEGPISLRYAVLARGARSVVSSLWPVADEVTADLMAEMYGGLTNKGYRADMALTMAMRGLLEKRPAMDPAMWAPYTVYFANPGNALKQ